MRLLRYISIPLFSAALLLLAHDQVFAQRVKQPRDVIEAHRVCNRFQQLFAKDVGRGRPRTLEEFRFHTDLLKDDIGGPHYEPTQARRAYQHGRTGDRNPAKVG